MEGTGEQYRWLVGDEAAAVLCEYQHLATDPLKAVESLRRELSPALAAMVCEQMELRLRATRKFAMADRMFFTRHGLEQSTGEVVARYKAARFDFADGIVDLCCGIGGDLLSLASRAAPDAGHRLVVGVDRDPVSSLFARSNSDNVGRAARIETMEVSAFDLTAFDAWHIDPDRRPDGRRTTSLEHSEPSLSVLDDLIDRNNNAAIKLAPATTVPDHWQREAQLEWISWNRECRQQIAWFGRLAQSSDGQGAGRRRATCLSSDGQHHTSVVGEASTEHIVTSTVGRYVYDPDPAVLAADLCGVLAAQCGLSTLGTDAMYLTGDQFLTNQPLTCFEVTEVVPGDLRQIKRLFNERDLRQVVIKKRGVPNEFADQVRNLKTKGAKGDRDATLILAQPQDRIIAILARRIAREGQIPSN